jgi:hypothetical protein
MTLRVVGYLALWIGGSSLVLVVLAYLTAH